MASIFAFLRYISLARRFFFYILGIISRTGRKVISSFFDFFLSCGGMKKGPAGSCLGI
jgi:hypothetical protein